MYVQHRTFTVSCMAVHLIPSHLSFPSLALLSPFLLYSYKSSFPLLSFSPLSSTLLHSTLLYSTLLYSTLLYSTLLYSTLLYSTLLSYLNTSNQPLPYRTSLHQVVVYQLTIYCSLNSNIYPFSFPFTQHSLIVGCLS